MQNNAVTVVLRKQLTLEAADAMAQAAIEEAKARRFKDISVAVFDSFGRELGEAFVLRTPAISLSPTLTAA